jgi:hypothetical protein
LITEIEKGAEVLLEKVDIFEKRVINHDDSINMISFKFPRFSKSNLLPIGILIFDDMQMSINLKLNDTLIFRSESIESAESMIETSEPKAKFSKKNFLEHSSFLSFFFT